MIIFEKRRPRNVSDETWNTWNNVIEKLESGDKYTQRDIFGGKLGDRNGSRKESFKRISDDDSLVWDLAFNKIEHKGNCNKDNGPMLIELIGSSSTIASEIKALRKRGSIHIWCKCRTCRRSVLVEVPCMFVPIFPEYVVGRLLRLLPEKFRSYKDKIMISQQFYGAGREEFVGRNIHEIDIRDGRFDLSKMGHHDEVLRGIELDKLRMDWRKKYPVSMMCVSLRNFYNFAPIWVGFIRKSL